MNAENRRKQIAESICIRRYDTVANLAKEYQVSERTIMRDIVALTERIPIYTKAGRYNGGIYIDPHYRMSKLYFEKEEVELVQRVLTCLEEKSFVSLCERDISALRLMLSAHEKPTAQQEVL